MKALRVILFAVLMLTAERVWPAAMTTLTNFNAVYFLVDSDPAATPTNVVLLTGNLTNWQKLTTNIVGALTINPTDLYVPYRSSATAFSDSYLVRLANEMYSTNSALRVARTGTFNDDGLPAQTFSVWGAGKNTGWQSVDDHAYLENNIQAIIGTNDPANSHSLTLWNQSLADPSIAYEAENSLSLDWIGNAWSTNQALSHQIMFSSWTKGVAAADDPTGTWVLESKVAALAAKTNLTVDSGTDFAMGTATGAGSSLIFGPGTTNVLYRSGSSLIVTNGAITNAFVVRNGLGTGLVLQFSPGGIPWVSSSSGTLVTDSALFTSGYVQPSGGAVQLGADTSSGHWNGAFLTNALEIAGMNPGTTNEINVRHWVSNTTAIINLTSQTNATPGPVTGFSFRTNGVEVFNVTGSGGPSSGANWTASGTTDSQLSGLASVSRIAATNGYLHQFKSSFSTNYSIGTSTNQQFFLLNGTNQLITLPPVAGVRGIIYRFSMTNGYGSFILTNAADSATIRDGTSSSYTNIGINEVGFLSDGSNWWLASKGKQIFPAASWSLNATISPVQDVITNIPWDTLEFNNSQGIALKTNATFAKPTQLWITNSGTYMITFSAVLKGSAGGSKLSIWLRKDGSDVSRTRTDQGFSGSTAQQCMTVNYFVAVSAPCFYELVAASHDATPPTIEYGAANPTGYTAPAMPAIILTINRVSDTWP